MATPDHIDRMIISEVLRIRKRVNNSREKLGLPPRDYDNTEIPDASLREPSSGK